MTTTIEIDDQLAEHLEAAAKARGVTLRDHVHQVLRQSLSTGGAAGASVYQLPVRDFGAHVENPWLALAEIESEEYRKLYTRK
ncbi:MAG: hypothetical protein ACO1QB_11225 [Verrucomicrobiales bacterium]